MFVVVVVAFFINCCHRHRCSTVYCMSWAPKRKQRPPSGSVCVRRDKIIIRLLKNDDDDDDDLVNYMLLLFRCNHEQQIQFKFSEEWNLIRILSIIMAGVVVIAMTSVFLYPHFQTTKKLERPKWSSFFFLFSLSLPLSLFCASSNVLIKYIKLLKQIMEQWRRQRRQQQVNNNNDDDDALYPLTHTLYHPEKKFIKL